MKNEEELLYRHRSSFKVGGGGINTYRGVLFFNIKSYIENQLLSLGYTSGTGRSFLNANLTITEATGKTSGNLTAFMLPLGTSMDDSASWTKPSEAHGTTWDNGGSVEPQAQDIHSIGSWNGSDLSFDVTPFANFCLFSDDPRFGVIIASDELSSETWSFHSQQAESPVIGGKPQTNAIFLGPGSTNSISMEGVVVKIAPQQPYLTLSSADSNTNAGYRWSAFNASVSVGDTFSMFLPDVAATGGIYTIMDKRESQNGVQMIISGSTAGLSSEIHTTGEFACTGRVPTGSGIVEFSSPDNSLIVDLSVLLPDDAIIFEYLPSVTPNNATSYTVDFYSDERLKNNRVRVYLNEQTASENRSGLNTTIKRKSVRPRLSVRLEIDPTTETFDVFSSKFKRIAVAMKG